MTAVRRDLLTPRRAAWPRHVDAVTDAGRAFVAAEYRLWDAVEAARSGGVPWRLIGAALGVTHKSAQNRFSKPPRGRLT